MPLPVVDRWFSREEHRDGITLVTEPYVNPFIRANMFWVRGGDADLLVDAGCGIASLRAELADLIERPLIVVASHSHYDHIGSIHEFETRLVHPAEADAMAYGSDFATLLAADFGPGVTDGLVAAGYSLPDVLITAVPDASFDVAGYEVQGATATGFLDEGDVVDLGDRRFTVLHTPGHSPGGISLLEEHTGVLIAGDAIYDGPLLDELPDSSIPDYLVTIRRLRELEVSIVHAGHDPSFGKARLVELCDAYLAHRG